MTEVKIKAAFWLKAVAPSFGFSCFHDQDSYVLYVGISRQSSLCFPLFPPTPLPHLPTPHHEQEYKRSGLLLFLELARRPSPACEEKKICSWIVKMIHSCDPFAYSNLCVHNAIDAFRCQLYVFNYSF